MKTINKQKIIDDLSKESEIVIATAYAYAKNYVEYGEDITKAWSTATRQTAIIEQIKSKALAEAYASCKEYYEACLKVDMLNTLKDLSLGLAGFSECSCPYSNEIVDKIDSLIQDKIMELKG